MKSVIAVPFIFVLSCVCALIVFSTLDALAVWGQSVGNGVISAAFIFQRFPQSLFLAMIPSVVTALVITGFRMARKPISRFLGLLLCLGASYIVLVNGMIWLGGVSKTVKPASPTAGLYVQPKVFQDVGGFVLSAQSISQGALKGVLLYSPAAPPTKRFFVYPTGRVSVSAGAVTVDIPGASPVRLTAEANPASSMFVPDAFTAFFLRDIDVLTSDFQKILAQSAVEFFIACFALLFLCTASMALLRLSRWPLINVLLYIAAIRLYFLFYHFLSVNLAPEAAKVIMDPIIAKLFPSVAFVVLGVVFLLIDVLFLPDKGLKGEAA